MKKFLTFVLVAFAALTVWGQTAPTANANDPTDAEANVIAIYSDFYGKGLQDNNPGWGINNGAPNPLYNSLEEVKLVEGSDHKTVHVLGTGMNSRPKSVPNADYSTAHVALYPFHATKCKIFDDNDYPNAIEFDGLIPEQWNYVTITGAAFTQNYMCIELVGETEFYLDHFYLAKPDEGNLVLTTLTIDASSTYPTVGSTVNINVIAKDQNGMRLAPGTITWNSTNPAVGTVADGVFTAQAAGTTDIKATVDGVTSNVITMTVVAEAMGAPTTNATEPTDLELNVIAIYSATYGKGLQENNPGWGIGGGAPNPLYTAIEEVNLVDGNDHKTVHVTGTGMNSRTKNAVAPNADYNTAHVALYPMSATKCKIFGDNAYGNAIEFEGLVPGQWNYVTIENAAFTQNYMCIELVGEHEFYLDHFYLAKPAVDDNVKPTLDKAELVKANAMSVVVALKATDDKAEKITYLITDQNGATYNAKGDNGVEIEHTVSGLKAGTDYTFTIVAQDENANTSDALTVQATTTALTAAPASTQAAEDVISIYSDAYTTATPNLGYYDWGSPTRFTGITIDGNPTLQFENMDYYGLGFNTQLDVTEMDFLHIDIYSDQAGTLGIVPIWWNAEANANFPEIRNTVNFAGGEWSSFDIPMSAFEDATRGGTNLMHQLKLDNGNGLDILVDNIYCYKNASVSEPTAITLEATATEVQATKTLQLTVKDQDSNNVAASKVTFTSSNDDIATVDEAGVVTGVAEGTATITATLNSDNTVTAELALTVTAAPEPTEGQVLTAGDHSVTLVGYHYVNETTNNYQLLITSEETLVGLGGSFWHINGEGTQQMNTPEVMSVAADGHSITVTTTSTTDPQIYTPLYVLMPGEVNFGMVTIEWKEVGEVTPPAITESSLADMETAPDASKTYLITEDLTVAFVDGDVVYARDNNGAAAQGPAEGQTDYVASYLALPANTFSNWIALTGIEDAEVGQTLTGVTGKLTDVKNYTMAVDDYEIGGDAGTVALNNYTPANLDPANRTNVERTVGDRTYNFWFAMPQVMEVAHMVGCFHSSDGNFRTPNATETINTASINGAFHADITGKTFENDCNVEFDVLIRLNANGTTAAPRRVAAAQGYDLKAMSNGTKVDDVSTAVRDINAATDVAAVKYVNAAGQVSAKPFTGLNIVVTTMSDGTVKTTKVVR